MEQQNKKVHELNYPITEEDYNKFLEEVKSGDIVQTFNHPFKGANLSFVWMDILGRPQKLEDGTIEQTLVR
jgi:hypothetical protein